jgi:hypothetical protein
LRQEASPVWQLTVIDTDGNLVESWLFSADTGDMINREAREAQYEN